MTAGTGVMHSEYNYGDRDVHLYQIWLLPDKNKLEPSYEQMSYSIQQANNRLLPLASGQGMPDTVLINVDATIYRSILEKNTELEYTLNEKRNLFIYMKNGMVTINNHHLSEGDQARISKESKLVIHAAESSEFVAIDTH